MVPSEILGLKDFIKRSHIQARRCTGASHGIDDCNLFMCNISGQVSIPQSYQIGQISISQTLTVHNSSMIWVDSVETKKTELRKNSTTQLTINSLTNEFPAPAQIVRIPHETFPSSLHGRNDMPK
jgi:hypothetical protein